MKVNRITLLLAIALIFSINSFGYDQTPKSNWATYGNVKLHYYDIGNSKTKNALVFVHCWTCNVEFWKESYGKFPNYRVIVIDLPGHGKSTRLNSSHGYISY